MWGNECVEFAEEATVQARTSHLRIQTGIGGFFSNIIWVIFTHTCIQSNYLKTVDNIGNCQRPVFSLGVSQPMHKITNLGQFELDWSSY